MMRTDDSLMMPDEYRIMRETEDSYWWYRALRLWLKRQINHHVPDRAAVIIDAGCGTGANLALLTDMGYHPIGFDLSPAAIRFSAARPGRPTVLNASTVHLPFHDNSGDGIISMDVLYLLGNEPEPAALREIHRVLKPGGWLLLNLPAFTWLRGEHDRAVAGQRRYTKAMLGHKLIAAGFDVIRAEYRCLLLLPVLWLLRRICRAGAAPAAARSDLTVKLGPLNQVLFALAAAEECIGRFVLRPFGTSIAAIARKR